MTERTPFLMVQNGPLPVRDLDDDDYALVHGLDKGSGLLDGPPVITQRAAANQILSIWTGSQAAYDALGVYSASTLYVIVG